MARPDIQPFDIVKKRYLPWSIQDKIFIAFFKEDVYILVTI